MVGWLFYRRGYPGNAHHYVLWEIGRGCRPEIFFSSHHRLLMYTFYSNKCVQSLDIWVKICYNIGMNKMRNNYKKETASVAAAGNIRVLGNDYPGVTTNRNFAANPNVLFVGYGSMAASQVV